MLWVLPAEDMRSSNTMRFLTPVSKNESHSKSDGIPCINSTGENTVLPIISYIGCHRLYSQIILCGLGEMAVVVVAAAVVVVVVVVVVVFDLI